MYAPKTAYFLAVVSSLLLPLAAVTAQDAGPTDWPSQCGDSGNSSSTLVVPPANLKILWEKPASTWTNPRVWVNSKLQQLVISGSFIYDAATGTLLHSFPHAAEYSCVTQAEGLDVLLIVTSGAYALEAYDVSDLTSGAGPKWLWTVTGSTLGIGGYLEINSKGGLFYAHGYSGVAALDATDGKVLWRSLSTEWQFANSLEYGPTCVGTVGEGSSAEDRVFVSGSGTVVALSDNGAHGADVKWRQVLGYTTIQPTFDEQTGLVYVATRFPYQLVAFDALTGLEAWDVAAPLDHILNAPASLGWAQKSAGGEVHRAVFALTGGVDGEAGVYAIDAVTGELLWFNTLPSDAHKAALFCGNEEGGKLYIHTNNSGVEPSIGVTYVLDALSGKVLEAESLPTDADFSYDNTSPAIANVLLPDDSNEQVEYVFEPVIYVHTKAGTVAAWSRLGKTPPPLLYELALEALPAEIAVSSETELVATLSTNTGDSTAGMLLTFSCDASNNQGYLQQTSADTNDDGQATVKFASQNRTGTVTVTVRGPGGQWAQTTISVIKTAEDPPPPSDPGSISGVVYTSAGKPARKVNVDLYKGEDPEPFQSVTTNPQGKYSFESLQLDEYLVSVRDGNLVGSTAVVLTESDPVDPNADVYCTAPEP